MFNAGVGRGMAQGSEERRRGRRVSLEAPVLIRRVVEQEPSVFTEHRARNISLAGVYFETDAKNSYAINDSLITSVSIPEPQRREFPFTRLAGRGRVVRINELPPSDSAGQQRFGIAVEFSDDLTALTATPSRS